MPQNKGLNERRQETLALLELLALSRQDLEAGRIRPVAEVFEDLRKSQA